MYKQASCPSFSESLGRTLGKIIKSNILDFQATDIDHILNSLLLALQTQVSKDGKDSSEKAAASNCLAVCSDLLTDCIAIMTDEQRKTLVECITSTLDKRQLMMSRETVE
jgi:hypothetical protein